MDRATELSLLEELAGLKSTGTAFLDDGVTFSDVQDYTSQARFDQESAHLFRQKPLAAAHASELPNSGDFVTRDLFGSPALITRDKVGEVHAFLNVCRHRGARLVDAASGCTRFSRYRQIRPRAGPVALCRTVWVDLGDRRSGQPHGYPDLVRPFGP